MAFNWWAVALAWFVYTGGVLCRAAAVVPVSQALYILPAFSNSLRLPSSAAAAAALLAFSALRSSYRGKVLAVLPIKLKERWRL